MSYEVITFIVGLSGPSSSGKTTLARLLRSIFNFDNIPNSTAVTTSLFILHEDDFYKTDQDIPVREVTSQEYGTRSLQDWDCIESLDLPLLESILQHVSRHGRLPPDMNSKEDQNSIGTTTVTQEDVKRHQQGLLDYLSSFKSDPTGPSSPTSSTPSSGTHTTEIRICILDGFLLFPPPPPQSTTTTSPTDQQTLHSILSTLLTHRLFLPTTRELTITRRAARTGYVTLEGFWADPPGYVEDVVWPNYARDHAWLFGGRSEDVDAGRVDGSIAMENGIDVFHSEKGGENVTKGMQEVLEWGVDVIKGLVGRQARWLGAVQTGGETNGFSEHAGWR